MDRRGVARVLEEMAAMLEIKGENPFKVKAYENGARAVLGMDQELAEAVQSGTLRQVPGIGAGLSSNIETLVRTGTLPYYEELKAAFPPGFASASACPASRRGRPGRSSTRSESIRWTRSRRRAATAGSPR